MEGEWSCYGGGQFNGGRMVMLQMSLEWMEKGHVRGSEVVSLLENSNVMEVASLKKGE